MGLKLWEASLRAQFHGAIAIVVAESREEALALAIKERITLDDPETFVSEIDGVRVTTAEKGVVSSESWG